MDTTVTPIRSPFIRSKAFPAVISALVAAMIYAVTLGGTYVYDDVTVVRNDPRVRDVDKWNLLLTRGYFDPGVDNLYRPAVSFSYALQWYFHDDVPWAFHLVNLLLNAAVAGLVAEFTRRLAVGRPGSVQAGLVAGILFAVHPIHVEAVANIVGRAELASALCVMSALVILIGIVNAMVQEDHVSVPGDGSAVGDHAGLNGRAGGSRFAVKWTVALAVAVIGLFCKEQAVLQPLLWVIGWFLLCRSCREPGSENVSKVGGLPAETTYSGSTLRARLVRPNAKLFVLCTCWIWAIYLAVREHFFKFEWDRSFLDWSVQPMVLSTGIDRVLMPVVLAGHYAALLVWPAHLSPDYGGDVIGAVVRRADPYLWIGVAAIAIWVAATAIAAVLRARAVVFCLICFAAVYGMTGNVITIIGTNMAERLMYLPTAFLFTAAGLAVARLDRRAVGAVMAPVALLLAIRTFSYARQWNRPAELFATALETHPGSVQLYLLLSQSYHDAGRYDLAETVLARACDRHPGYYRVWVMRAENAMDRHDWPAAHRWIAIALKEGGNHQQVAAAMGELEAREPKKR